MKTESFNPVLTLIWSVSSNIFLLKSFKFKIPYANYARPILESHINAFEPSSLKENVNGLSCVSSKAFLAVSSAKNEYR